MIAVVTFPSSAKEYHYKVGRGTNLKVGNTYRITNNEGQTYGSHVTVQRLTKKNSPLATRTIIEAVLVSEGTVAPVIKTRVAPLADDIVKNIIFSGPMTVVLWKDGTKTMVRQDERDTYNRSEAIAYCFMKKMFGNTSEFNNVLRKYNPEAYADEK